MRARVCVCLRVFACVDLCADLCVNVHVYMCGHFTILRCSLATKLQTQSMHIQDPTGLPIKGRITPDTTHVFVTLHALTPAIP